MFIHLKVSTAMEKNLELYHSAELLIAGNRERKQISIHQIYIFYKQAEQQPLLCGYESLFHREALSESADMLAYFLFSSDFS